MRRLLVAVAAFAACLALPATASAEDVLRSPQRVILAFLPLPEDQPEDAVPPQPILDVLAAHPQLALGLVGATQGRYTQEQALLDMGQGSRTSAAAYSPENPPDLAFYETDGGGLFQGWLDALDRARSALADIEPGLLGQRIPGGTAYAGVIGRSHIEALPAADRAGRVARVSIGRSRDVAQRALDLRRRYRLVVAGLPTGSAGAAQLSALLRKRRIGDLVIAMELPPDRRAPQLLAAGVVGAGAAGALTSATTRLEGVIAGIDLAPTILEHLGLRVPSAMKGQPIAIEGRRDAEGLQALDDRLRVVSPRRFPAGQTLLAAWLLVLLVLALWNERRGTRMAFRLAALAVFWILPLLLLTAALHPGRTVEMAIVAGGALLLAAATDRFLPWPRGPLVPCAVTIVAYVVDLARGSDLIIRSLLGPNPRFGSRYYGIGNELESTLPVLLFIALAVILHGRGRTWRTAGIFAACGAVLALLIGWGRLGADVGGVITIGAGTAVGTLLLLPGRMTRRRLAVAALVPALALGALAVLDLATGGDGHFTRTVLRADSGRDLEEIVQRRYRLAWDQLLRGLMPFAAGVALLGIAYGLRYRARLYAPLRGDPAWNAALGGGIAVGIAGALFNDSGPLLLVLATAAVGFATLYVRGAPELAAPSKPAPADVPGEDPANEPSGHAPASAAARTVAAGEAG